MKIDANFASSPKAVRAEFRRLCRLAGVRPTLTLRYSRTRRLCSGTCWPDQQRIVVTIGTDRDPADVIETLAHEVAHAAAAPPRTHHGDAFRSVLVDLIDRAYGVRVEPPNGGVGWLDRALTEGLRVKLGLAFPLGWGDLASVVVGGVDMSRYVVGGVDMSRYVVAAHDYHLEAMEPYSLTVDTPAVLLKGDEVE